MFNSRILEFESPVTDMSISSEHQLKCHKARESSNDHDVRFAVVYISTVICDIVTGRTNLSSSFLGANEASGL